MGTYYADTHGHSVLRDASEGTLGTQDQANVPVLIGDEFILCVQVAEAGCNRATETQQFKLQVKKDAGSFEDVTDVSEISWGSGTTLVDGATGTERCTSTPATCPAGNPGWIYENEGDNLTGSYTLATDEYGELQFALDTTNATNGSVYTFQVVNVTDSNSPLANAVASSAKVYTLHTGEITGGLGGTESTEADRIIDGEITGGLGGSVDLDVQGPVHVEITGGLGGGDDIDVQGPVLAEITAAMGGHLDLVAQAPILVEITGALGTGHDDIYYGTRHYAEIAGGLGGGTTPWREKEYTITPTQEREEFNSADADSHITVNGTYNEKIWASVGSGWYGCRTKHSQSKGKWYFEIGGWEPSTPGGQFAEAISAGVADGDESLGTWFDGTGGWCLYIKDNGSTLDIYGRHGGLDTYPDDTRPIVAADRVMVAVDLDAGKIWLGFRGSWLDGDPAEDGTPAYDDLTGALFIAASAHNFGTDPLMCAELFSLQSEMTYTAPTGFTPGWVNGPTQYYEKDQVVSLGLDATLDGNIPIQYGDISGDIGLSHQIYTGEGVEYLVEIIGALGVTGVPTPPGSTYQGNIIGGLGGGESDDSEWDWEPTLFRYLDGRSGQVGAQFGGFIKANVYGEAYFLYYRYSFRSYVLTVTGGTGPIEIPMVQFQLKLRDGPGNRLAVQIIGPYADEIRARAGGTMTLESVWRYSDAELTREVVVIVPIEETIIKERADETVISMSGTLDKSYPGAKTVILDAITYEAMTEGKLRYRGAYNPDLEPGDTVNAGDRTLTADEVSLSVVISQAGKVSETMEVGEGARE